MIHTDKTAQSLLAWYDANRRELPWRENTDPYRVWVSEIMLQQTRVEAARGYFIAFIDRFPSVDKLAAVRLEDVYKVWEGLGYYSRAKRLHEAARIIRANKAFPHTYGEWLRLPGVGAYTAAAIASICFGERILAVDANVTRVVMRLLGMRELATMPSTQRAVRSEGSILLTNERPGDGNQALMELGAMVCVPRAPRCDVCPLAGVCSGYARGYAAEIPLMPPKKGRQTERLHVCVVVSGGKVLVRKRPDSGLLASQWEFPYGISKTDLGRLNIHNERALPPHRHVFTHKIWEMTGALYRGDATFLPGDTYRWVNREELLALPIPSAMAPFRASALEALA